MLQNRLSVGAAFYGGFITFRDHWLDLSFLTVCWFAGAGLFALGWQKLPEGFTVLHGSFVVVGIVALSWMLLCYISATMRLARGYLLSYGELVVSVERLPSFILTGVAATGLTLVGLLLAVVPGVIASIAFMLAGHVAADEKGEGSPVAALLYSAHLARGRYALFLRFATVATILNVIGGATIIGLLVTLPVTAVATARLYDQCRLATD